MDVKQYFGKTIDGLYKASINAVLVASLSAPLGCATKSYVNERVSEVKETVASGLESILEAKQNPILELTLKKGDGYDSEFGAFKALALTKYKDPKSRKEADEGADMLYIRVHRIVTNEGKRKLYEVFMLKDTDKNNLPSLDNDRIFDDERSGDVKPWAFLIKEGYFSEEFNKYVEELYTKRLKERVTENTARNVVPLKKQ